MRGYIFGAKHYAHRVIWAIVYDEWPRADVDHIDGDPRNNRIENLRNVSHRINMRNAKKQKNNTSGYNGVHWDKRDGMWCAKITISGHTTRLGLFFDMQEAIAARKKAEINQGYTDRHGS